MPLSSRVFVIVPAWQEAPRIERVVRGLPPWVHRVIVVDDASTDGTREAALAAGDARVEVARHDANRGVGAAIVTGYRRALADRGSSRDAFVVMAGDGQMDPADLPAVVAPIAAGGVDYVKGDRFRGAGAARSMPLGRRVGGRVFSWATGLAIGVPISDSQCGYTAIARAACARLDLAGLWPRYGYPNDLLAQLAARRLRIAEVPVRAVYADEISRLKPRHVPVVAGLIARAAARRIADRLSGRAGGPVAEGPVEDRGDVGEGVVEIE
ncbi:MAG TPA: glycosyltransferase family 2 protein [Polyangiaceae bacterium]|nr:glycosyltransferase family 2 protein [Polyangiaceae bacterium]